ncbi:hypothetical protein [Taklimakanibacter deserti]|uniref:hypothetical protein n=1 Tax=Taklimakanibacter deserti TaxID=2267839 RepID=UPI000E64CB70
MNVHVKPPNSPLNGVGRLKKTLILSLLCLFAANSSFAGDGESSGSRLFTKWQKNQISISNDNGGYIVEYALRKASINRSSSKVRFSGRCASACTMFLGLPHHKMCIAPGASFQFHMPRAGSVGATRQAKRFLYRNYPGWVRSWIASRGGLSSTMITMNHNYASKFIRAC